MGVTAGGLPYPEPTDPVAAGADAIRALAEAIEARLLGDTGWVVASLPGSFASGSLVHRRLGRMVTVSLSGLKSASGYTGTIPVLTLPAALWPTQHMRGVGINMASTSTTAPNFLEGCRMYVGVDGVVNITGVFVANCYITGLLTYPV